VGYRAVPPILGCMRWSGARVDGAATRCAVMMAELNPVPFGRRRGRGGESAGIGRCRRSGRAPSFLSVSLPSVFVRATVTTSLFGPSRLPLQRVVRSARATCSKRRKSESGKSSRFLPRQRVGTDRGQTVHPLRAADGLNASDGHGLAFSPRATPIGRRAEEQHVPKCSGVRRR